MKRYIVITPDGYCEDLNGDEIGNCQVIGTYEANSKEDAIKQAITDLEIYCRVFEDFIAYEIL